MNATVYFCFASSQLSLGPFTLAPQSVWAANKLLTRVGNVDYQWCLIEGDSVARLVAASEVIEAASKSTAVEYPLDAIWPNGITQNQDDLDQLQAQHAAKQEEEAAAQRARVEEQRKRVEEQKQAEAERAADPNNMTAELQAWAANMITKLEATTTGDRGRLNVIGFNLPNIPNATKAVTDAAFLDLESPFRRFVNWWDELQADTLEDPFEWNSAPLHDLVNYIGGRISMQAARGNSVSGQTTQWVRILKLIYDVPAEWWEAYFPMTRHVRPPEPIVDNLISILSGIDTDADAANFIYPQRFADSCDRKVEAVFMAVASLTPSHFALATDHLNAYRNDVTKYLATCQYSNDRGFDGRAENWSPLYWADELYNRGMTSIRLNPLIAALTNDPNNQEKALEDFCLNIIAKEKTAHARSQAADTLAAFLQALRPLGADADYSWDKAVGKLDRPNPAWASLRRWLVNRVWETGGASDNTGNSELEALIATSVSAVKSSGGTFSAISVNATVFRKFAQDVLTKKGPVAAGQWIAYVEAGCPDFNPLNANFIIDAQDSDILSMLMQALKSVAFQAAYDMYALQPDKNKVSESGLYAVAYSAAQNEASSFRRVAACMCPLDQRPFQWAEIYWHSTAKAYKFMTENDIEPYVDEAVREAVRKVLGGTVSEKYMFDSVHGIVEKALANTPDNRGWEYVAEKYASQRQILIDTCQRIASLLDEHSDFTRAGGWAVSNAPYLSSLLIKLSPVPVHSWNDEMIMQYVKSAAKAMSPEYASDASGRADAVRAAIRAVSTLIIIVMQPIVNEKDVAKWIVQNREACPKRLREVFITLTSMQVDDTLVRSVFGHIPATVPQQSKEILDKLEETLNSLRGTSDSQTDCAWEYIAAQRDSLLNARRKLFKLDNRAAREAWKDWTVQRGPLLLSVHPQIRNVDEVLVVAANAVRREARASAEANAAKVLGLLGEVAVLLSSLDTEDGDESWAEWRAPSALRIVYRSTLRPIRKDVNAQGIEARHVVSQVVRLAFDDSADYSDAQHEGVTKLIAELAAVPKAPYMMRLRGQTDIIYTARSNVVSFNKDREEGRDTSAAAEYFTALTAAFNDLTVLRATELKETHGIGNLTDMLVQCVRESLTATKYTVADIAVKCAEALEILQRLFVVVRPAELRVTAWNGGAVDAHVAPTLRKGMRDLEAIVDSSDDLLALITKNFADVCDLGVTKAETKPVEQSDGGMPGRIVRAPMPRTGSGSMSYVAVKPSNPATGIDMEALFNPSNSNPQTQRVLTALGRKYGMYELDSEIIADLAHNSAHLGVRKKLPIANIVVVGCDSATCILSANLGGQLVGIIMLNPKELAGIFGSFSTQSALHAITHELGHYVHRSIKGTKKLDWDRAIAGRRNLHPKQGKDGYAFDTEQFAILAEAMVWGDSCRGLFTCNGYNVVAEFFVDNYLTDEDRQRIV